MQFSFDSSYFGMSTDPNSGEQFRSDFPRLHMCGVPLFQVNKYMHAKIQTVSGIRGEIKKVNLCWSWGIHIWFQDSSVGSGVIFVFFFVCDWTKTRVNRGFPWSSSCWGFVTSLDFESGGFKNQVQKTKFPRNAFRQAEGVKGNFRASFEVASH